MTEKYLFMLSVTFMGKDIVVQSEIPADRFGKDGPQVGDETRGEFGFIKVTKVYGEPHPVFGYFEASSIEWEHLKANAHLKGAESK